MESVEEEKEEEAAGGVEMQHCIGTTGVECSGGRESSDPAWKRAIDRSSVGQ